VGGGVASEINGGDFGDGAAIAGALAAAATIYNNAVGYPADASPGGPAVQKTALSHPVAGANNIGTQGGAIANPAFLAEGGTLSVFLNEIPGFNAIAGLHDLFQINLGTGWERNVFNVPGMPAAAALSLGAIGGQAPGFGIGLLTTQADNEDDPAAKREPPALAPSSSHIESRGTSSQHLN